MPRKVKVNFSFKKLGVDIRKEFIRQAQKEDVADAIIKQVVSGKSPVRGYGTYKKYSKKYAEKKGRYKPVDLVQSGDMLESVRVKRVRGKLRIWFKSILATYHNRGAGNLPVRRILPERGETFKKKILDEFVRILRKSIKRARR